MLRRPLLLRTAVLALSLSAGLSAQAGAGNILANPWVKPAINFAIDRALTLASDPKALHAFFQGNADDFSPGLFKTHLGNEWRSIAETSLDNRSKAPFSHRFDLSFNLFSLVPSAQLQFHAIQEGPFWPQVTLAFSGWMSPINLVLSNYFQTYGWAPHITLSKSLTKDAKFFLGYQYAAGDTKATLSTLSSLAPNVMATNYQSHEIFAGAVFVDRFNAEYAAWIDFNLVRQELYLKVERTQGILSLGVGLYPDSLVGILPIPYARFRVRI